MADSKLEIILAAKDTSEVVFRGFKSRLTAAGSAMTGFGALATTVFAGTAATAIFKTKDAASDLQETVSKAETIFGTQAEAIKAWAEDSDRAMGLSKKAAIDAVGTMGNMFKQLGASQADAAGLSQGMVELSADLASFHNVAGGSEAVLVAMQSAFRGEYDALQRYIPTINAAAVQHQALADTGKTTAKELTALEKALAAQTIVMKDAGDAVGDFARTSGNEANQSRILQAQLEDLSATVGTALLPAYTKAVTGVNDWVEANDELIAQKVEATVDAIAIASGKVVSIYTSLPEGVVGVAGAGIVGRIMFGGTSAGKMAAGVLMLNQAMAALPDTFRAYDFSVQNLARSYGEANEATTNFWNALKAVFSGERDWNTGALKGMAEDVNALQIAASQGVDWDKVIIPADEVEESAEAVADYGAAVSDLWVAYEDAVKFSDEAIGDLEYEVAQSISRQQQEFARVQGWGIYYERTATEGAMAIFDMENEMAASWARSEETSKESFYSFKNAFSDIVVDGVIDGIWDIESALDSMLRGMSKKLLESGLASLDGVFGSGGGGGGGSAWGGFSTAPGSEGSTWTEGSSSTAAVGALAAYGAFKSSTGDDNVASWASAGAGIGGQIYGIVGAAAGAVIGGLIGGLTSGEHHGQYAYSVGGPAEKTVIDGGDYGGYSEIITAPTLQTAAGQQAGGFGWRSDWTAGALGITDAYGGSDMPAVITEIYNATAAQANSLIADIPDEMQANFTEALQGASIELGVYDKFDWGDTEKAMGELAEGLAEQYAEALEDAALAIGYSSLAELEAYLERLAVAGQASASLVTNAWAETLAAGGGFEDFGLNLKGSVYESVLGGLTEAFMQSEIIQEALRPTMLAVQDAFSEASAEGAFDMDVFNALIGPALGGLDDQLAGLQPLFDAMSGITGTVQSAIYGESFASLDARRQAVLDEYGARAADIEAVYSSRLDEHLAEGLGSYWSGERDGSLADLDAWRDLQLAGIPSYAMGGGVDSMLVPLPLPANESGYIAAQAGETVLTRRDTGEMGQMLRDIRNDGRRVQSRVSGGGRRASTGDGVRMFADVLDEAQRTGAGRRYVQYSPVRVGMGV